MLRPASIVFSRIICHPPLTHLVSPQALLKAKDAEIRTVRETLSAGMVPVEEAEALRAALVEARYGVRASRGGYGSGRRSMGSTRFFTE